MNWYFREASVAVYVTCCPGIWVLLRDLFPSLQRLGNSTKKSESGNKYDYGQYGQHGQAYVTSQVSKHDIGNKSSWMKMSGSHFDRELKEIDMEELPINKQTKPSTRVADREVGVARSTESGQDDASISSHGGGLEIRRDVTFSVEHQTRQNV